MVYEDEPLPVLKQIQIWLHVFLCPDCAAKIERLQSARKIMSEDFFPASPDIEDAVMAKVSAEEETLQPQYEIPAGLSTRGWIISGLIIFISLATAFFGFDFKALASEHGMSFLLPVGITVGIVLTTYGVIFIGSHLKELTERFGL
jgi:hypothetical protein